jgi:hypothetical protein
MADLVDLAIRHANLERLPPQILPDGFSIHRRLQHEQKVNA